MRLILRLFQTPPVATAVLDDISRRGQKRSYPSVDNTLPSSSKQTSSNQTEVLQLQKQVLLKDNENADRMKTVLEQVKSGNITSVLH